MKQPAMDFVVFMGEKLRQIAPGINAIPAVNKSLFRLNRDIRFSRDKSPYKTHLGIWFWEGRRKRMECPGLGFYFHLEDRRLMLGTGIHMFPGALLKLYRQAVVDGKNGPQLEKKITAVAKKGYSIVGQHYKRVPRGFDASHKNAEYLKYNGLTAMIEGDLPEELFSKKIVGYAFTHFKNMSPLHDWLKNALI
ncbi:MAG: DUF2461 domain-containing protein [Deltaproteobacteria bacterium]|nr:DUF2461 domain-containing protein [Deltaproteobacteria bacterium]